MVFDAGGILRGDDGHELARAEALPSPALARVVVGDHAYEIEKPHALGWHFQLLDGDARVVYDFKPTLRRGGTVLSGEREQIAALRKAVFGTGWTITAAGSEPIEVKRRTGFVGSVVSDDGRIVAPDLDLSLPASVPVGDDLPRLLAFVCWLIAEWDT